MAYGEEPRVIGGWLVLFLVTRGSGIAIAAAQLYFACVGISYAAASGLADFPLHALAWPFVMPIFTAICDGYLIWRFLRRRNWRTVLIGIALLWAMAAATPVLAALALAIRVADPYYVLSDIGFRPLHLLWFIASALIWTAYLLRSKRVANTYLRRGPVDAEDLPAVFE
jgi:hypothetical protein